MPYSYTHMATAGVYGLVVHGRNEEE